MKKKFIPLAFVAIVVILIVYRIATHANTEKVKSIGQIQKETGVPVVVEEAKITGLDKTLNFTGNVEGVQQSDACVKISEKIVSLKVKIGDKVEAGQLIASLDQSSPQVAYSQAKLALEDAQSEMNRMKSLFEQGAISKQMYDKVVLGYDVAKANFTQVSELLQVTAPISGTVTKIFYYAGETPPPGDPVATIAKTDGFRIELHAAPSYRAELKKGQKAWVYLSNSPDHKINGFIDEISLSADPESRSFTVWVVTSRADGILQPGISVEVDVVTASKPKALAVHRDAVITDKGETVVFVAEAKAKRVPVTIGMTSNSSIEILSGLNSGDKVIVNGQNLLADGDPIVITN